MVGKLMKTKASASREQHVDSSQFEPNTNDHFKLNFSRVCLPICRAKLMSSFLFFLLLKLTLSSADNNFTFNGFTGANLTLDGAATITSTGLLQLTKESTKGHAFHPLPLHFKSATGNKTLSFSTTFVFAILSEIAGLSGHGLAFLISPTADLSSALPAQYLGLFNITNNGNSSNHIFAVELDTIQNPEFQDINANHVGIDLNGLASFNSTPAGYYDNTTGSLNNLTLISGREMQVWVDFDGESRQLDVTLAPVPMTKPKRPLLSSTLNLDSLMQDTMYAGFSASSGDPFHTNHYVLGWSFRMNGVAGAIDYSKLPPLPVTDSKGNSNHLAIWLPIASVSLLLVLFAVTVVVARRRMKYAELREDWEQEYGPHRFSYKELFQATNGFKDKELLGTGGFGRVYKGVLPATKMEVAVKRVSHESRQGMREFVAEIVSIGQLRHRNLVQLLGYCRRKGELLLVYDFMPNGSLDRFLYDRTRPTLNWAQRFRIIKGVASGLLYLHEDWEQVVIHRDIKASNVLLDGELNGRLGDFGLAKLYDRGTDPQTTRVVGTMGYLAPELAMMGKATTVTDVFAFGTFLLEVVCGRRPIAPHSVGEDLVLVDWVLENSRRESLIETLDSRLREEFDAYEVESVLKLGLLCSHPMPAARPSMRQVMQILDGDAKLSDFLPSFLTMAAPSSLPTNVGFDDYNMSFAATTASHSGNDREVDVDDGFVGQADDLSFLGRHHNGSSEANC